jgi:hypothetical protein
MTSSAEFAAHSTRPAHWPASHRDNKEIFAKAREQTLNLVQWLARVANSYVAGGLPQDRVALDFRPDGALVTKTFGRDIALEMRLPGLEMQFQERGKPMPHILDPEERSPAEVEAWILVELLHRGLDRDKFSKTLPYTIKNLMSGDAEDYSPQACAAGLAQLTAWFRAAASVLSNDGRVVCLPQTLMLVHAPGHVTPAAGFSPGDGQHDEPYFFVDTGNGGKRRLLTASELSSEKYPAAAAAQFIKATVRPA